MAMTKPTIFDIDRLVNDLAKPTYTWRMAWHMSFKKSRQQNSAIARRDNAGIEIERIVREWVREHPVD